MAKNSKKEKKSMTVEERMKSISKIDPPDENPFKKENEDKIDHWRPAHRNDRRSIKEKNRMARRHNRPKKSSKKKY